VIEQNPEEEIKKQQEKELQKQLDEKREQQTQPNQNANLLNPNAASTKAELNDLVNQSNSGTIANPLLPTGNASFDVSKTYIPTQPTKQEEKIDETLTDIEDVTKFFENPNDKEKSKFSPMPPTNPIDSTPIYDPSKAPNQLSVSKSSVLLLQANKQTTSMFPDDPKRLKTEDELIAEQKQQEQIEEQRKSEAIKARQQSFLKSLFVLSPPSSTDLETTTTPSRSAQGSFMFILFYFNYFYFIHFLFFKK